MTVLDLFAGPGGWDLAARRLGLDPVGLELDDHACATRRAAGLRTMQCDVAAVDLDSGWVGMRLAGLIASPPCQAFSMAGSGAGRAALDAYLDAVARTAAGAPPSRDELDEACHDDRAHLVLEPLRWALALRPRWVALEQVEPVLPIWEATADALRAAGYGAWTGVLSAERYGVPQTRRRAILLASLDRAVGEPAATHQRYVAPRRRDEATESLFEPPEPERIVAPEDRDLLPWVSMAEALGWGMIARPGLTFAAGTKSGGASSDGTGGTGARRILEGERAAGRWADVELVNGDLDHAARRRADEPAPTIKNGDLSGRRWVLRVNGQPNAAVRGADEPAPTITTGGHDLANRIWLRAGTNPHDASRRADEPANTLRFEARLNDVSWVGERPATTVNGDPRVSEPGRHDPDVSGSQQANAVRVTVAEALALQSFPPDYPVQGTKTKQFEQVGNAVPVLLAEAVLRAVVTPDPGGPAS